MTNGAPCYVCGADPREPFTPAAFPENGTCHCCDRDVCDKHSDVDGDCVGDPPQYECTVTCFACVEHREACA